jgi:hypothetical protein
LLPSANPSFKFRLFVSIGIRIHVAVPLHSEHSLLACSLDVSDLDCSLSLRSGGDIYLRWWSNIEIDSLAIIVDDDRVIKLT